MHPSSPSSTIAGSRWLRLGVVSLWLLTLVACHSKSTFNLGDYMDDDSETADYTADGEIRVPYRDRGGVKTVSCLINGTLREDMIFDSGCSGTLISSAEAEYLWQKGILTQDDYLGTTSGTIADGSTMEAWLFVIRSLVIGDQLECNNVVVTVAANPGADLLLGNEVLDRFAGYTIDNARHEIVFHLQ